METGTRNGSGAALPDKTTLIALIFNVLFAGTNVVAVRLTVGELPPFWGAALRFSAAALIFWLIVLLRKSPLPSRRVLPGILLYGFFNIGASYAFLYWGLQKIPASMTSIFLALAPLMTLFLAALHRIERFRWRGLAGASLALAGILFAFFEQPSSQLPIVPMLALVAGVACLAESTVIIKMIPASDPLTTNAFALSTGAVVLNVLSLLRGEAHLLPTQPETWASVAYLIVFGSVVMFYLFLYVVRRWTATATSYQFVLFPFVTVVIAGWLADETVNTAFLIGGAVTLFGVWIGALSGMRAAKPATTILPEPSAPDTTDPS